MPFVTLLHRLRTVRILIAGLLALFLFQPAFAEPAQPFSEPAFKAAQRDGKTILVEVHANWCAACRKQAPILESLSQEKPYSSIARFRVDIDQPGAALKMLKVHSQATLVLLKGNKEIARSTFDLDPRSIRAMLAKAS